MFLAFLVVMEDNGSSWMLISLWCRSMEDVLNSRCILLSLNRL